MSARLLHAGLVAICVVLAAGSAASRATGATALPPHLYAPYFETWTTNSISTIAEQSGSRYLTLAFLETLSKTSCTLAWNGRRSNLLSGNRYLNNDDITTLRGMGGDVIPSFGGWSADQGGREIADSCKHVNAIAAAYEDVITRYDVARLDMDVEGRSVKRPKGIDRRNKALKIVQAWAKNQNRPFQVSYTLPTSATGLRPSGIAVLQNAIDNGTNVDVVNIMAFDYYDRVTTDLGAAAISALNGMLGQLATLYPGKTAAERAAMVGITLMPGLDDYPRRTENTSVADAQSVYTFARNNSFNTLSIWAVQRDNGGCPRAAGSNNCSGIVQNTWDFSHVLNPFSGTW
jgi:hypothetical protein